MDGIAEIGTKLAARGRGCTCQWNVVALLSNLRRRWRADDSRELQGGVEEDCGEARFDGPPAAPPLSASPAPAPARADKMAGGPKRIRRETEISSSWRQTRAVGHLLPVGLAPLEILGLQQPTPVFMGHPFGPLDCAYRLGALELVSSFLSSGAQFCSIEIPTNITSQECLTYFFSMAILFLAFHKAHATPAKTKKPICPRTFKLSDAPAKI